MRMGVGGLDIKSEDKSSYRTTKKTTLQPYIKEIEAVTMSTEI
jgi:hypothetical protein